MVVPQKILVIKLGAIGDVLRTTPILHGLKRKYPWSLISWLTQEESRDLLKDNPLVDRLLIYGPDTLSRLALERFDVLISLDKEYEATSLATVLRAKIKIGFGWDKKTGKMIPLNKESLYAFRLGISDELKFRQNQKTYPEIIFEMAGLKYRNDEYILKLKDSDRAYAAQLLSRIKLNTKTSIIGLNTGAGTRFANKAWTEDGFVELTRFLGANTRSKVLLLGGPQESRRNARIISRVRGLAYDTGSNHSLSRFAAIIGFCTLVVSGDTTALHIAIALKKKVVALFGSTCAQEIELYGRGRKIFSDIKCRPCYRKICHKRINCMSLIKPSEVFRAIQDLLPK